MFKIRQLCLNFSQKTSFIQIYQHISKYSSTPIPVVPKSLGDQVVSLSNSSSIESTSKNETRPSRKNPMVAAAFAALKDEKNIQEVRTPKIDERIKEAKSVEELLALSEGSGISRRLALKIVSVLADWSSANKVQLQEFDRDPRFIRLCKVLTKSCSKSHLVPQSEDLSMVVNVTADDEAARLINSLSIQQMIRVIGMLASRKRRSIPLLRSISFNISRLQEPLDLKQCADLLYGSACLNYLDDILLEKVCRDISVQLKNELKGSAVIGSILTSLGLIRYKDSIVLDSLSDWIVSHCKDARSQDVFALFLTLAVVNHYPENNEVLFNTVLPQLTISDASKMTAWLDFVWSLVILNQATSQHIESVLKEEFVQRIVDEGSVTHKLKILNINAAASLLLKDYKGSKLSKSSSINGIVCARSKNKEALVSSVIDTLSNLFPLDTYLKTNINTGLGFYLDGECCIDKNANALPLDKRSPDSIRVAVIVYDFHDMCRKRIEPTGINVLLERLLKVQGFKLLTVPYTEYNPRDKLVQRVQYLKNKLDILRQL